MLNIDIDSSAVDNALNKAVERLHDFIYKIINNNLKNIQQLAISFAPVNNGELKDNIKITIDDDNNEVKGMVYVDPIITYQFFVEYGTGIYASPLGEGSKAKKIPWYVHESMANLDKYNFAVRNTKNGKFYVIYGTEPQLFMTRAAFYTKEDVLHSLLKGLENLCK